MGDGTGYVGQASYDTGRPKWLFDLDNMSWRPICPGTNGLGQILG
jgi:hypothetical protein